MITKIKEILLKDLNQRIVYGFGLTLWTMISWDSLINFPFASSSIMINYLTLYIIPAIILGLQIIRNNKILWLIIFGLFTSYILIAIYLVLTDIIERNGNHVKAINLDIKDIFVMIIIFTSLGIVDWIIYRLSPRRMI